MPTLQDAVKRALLQVPLRRAVYEAVVATPGTHVRALARDLGMALGTVQHHVRQLQKHNLVFDFQAGRRRALFAQGHVKSSEADLHYCCRKPVWRALLAQLVDDAAGVGALANQIGLPPATTGYHLRRLRDLGLVTRQAVGRESLYMLTEPRRVAAHLQQAGPGLGLGPLAARAAMARVEERTTLLKH